MAVHVREKVAGSGIFWVFVNHEGIRKAKKVGSEKTALEVAEVIKARIALGEHKLNTRVPRSPTFKDYGEKWLNLPHDWKESTKEAYEFNLTTHVYPHLGKHRLHQIRRKDLKAFFDGLLLKGLSVKTVLAIKAPMMGVFAEAVDAEVIDHNPLQDLKMKDKSKALAVEPLTEGEVGILLDQAKKYLSGFYYPPILCALMTGVRVGELQALKWGDIDFHERFIQIKRSWRRDRLTDTKSGKWRRVDMTPLLTETLKASRLTQKKQALKEGRPVTEWVFGNSHGKMLQREAFGKGLNRCMELGGHRHIRVHDLRHSYATIRLLRGHNIGDVCSQLGHHSIKMTWDVYCHWIPGKYKSEVDDLDNLQLAATQAQPATPMSIIL